MDFFVRKDYQRIVLYLVAVVVILFMLKYLLPYFLPLFFSLLIVVPLQRFCIKRGKTGKKGFMAGGILFGIILAVALIMVVLGVFIIGRTKNIVQDFEVLAHNITDMVGNMCKNTEAFLGMKNGTITIWVNNAMQGLGGSIAGSGNGLLRDGFKYMSVVGHVATFVLVSFICVILFAREIEQWQQGLLRLASLEPAIDRILSIILRIGKKLGTMIKTFLKTQTIIWLCISTVSAAGLFLAGVKDAIFYGILAGLLDFMPFIGTGIVLIPLGVVSVIKGELFRGIAILGTYLVCAVIREFVEPRLLGNGMKFSPVAILVSVYAGLKFYGVSGVVLGPVTLLILVELGREIFIR